MTEINQGKFYQFLTKFESDGGWDKVADSEYGNGDGSVIKSEFRKFINAEWNGEQNGELNNDLINSFWKSIDTNTSASKIKGTKLKNLNALDSNEVKNLDKQLEIYIQFDEFVAKNVVIPNVLTTYGNQWKNDVRSELNVLLEKFISEGCKGDLNAILSEALPAIANKTTAQYCAVEYQESLKSTILNSYPEYKVADDSTLQTLISNYIATLDGNADANTIKNDIKSILDAYLASAGLGEDSGYPIEDLGFNKDAMNDIQKAVITQTIKNDLSNDANNYDGYENEFNKAVEQFIDDKIKSGGDFETLKNAASEFNNSKFKTQLDNAIAINTNFGNINEDSAFYGALVEKFGETLAKKIAQNERYIDAYKEIIKDVTDKVNSGNLAMDEVEKYVLEQISANIDKFLTNGFGNATIEELNTTYDKLAESAEAVKDDNKALEQHRTAAIKYCDSLVKVNDKVKALVKEVFGTDDYASVINNLYPSEIKELIAELKAKASDIGDLSTFTVSWSNVPEQVAEVGSTLSISLNATVKNGDKAINDASRVTYKASVKSGSGSAEFSDLGVLTVTAQSTSGYMTVEVSAYVDGEKVGEPKLVTIKCQESSAAIVAKVKDWNGEKSENLKTIGVNQGQQVTSTDFASLYGGDALIQLEYNEKSKGWNDSKNLVKTRLTNFGNHVIAALATAGLDKAKLTTATTKVINKYMDNHVSYKWSSGSGGEGSLQNKVSTKFKENVDARHSIVEVYDKTGTNSHIFAISFKDFVDDIIAEYYKL